MMKIVKITAIAAVPGSSLKMTEVPGFLTNLKKLEEGGNGLCACVSDMVKNAVEVAQLPFKGAARTVQGALSGRRLLQQVQTTLTKHTDSLLKINDVLERVMNDSIPEVDPLHGGETMRHTPKDMRQFVAQAHTDTELHVKEYYAQPLVKEPQVEETQQSTFAKSSAAVVGVFKAGYDKMMHGKPVCPTLDYANDSIRVFQTWKQAFTAVFGDLETFQKIASTENTGELQMLIEQMQADLQKDGVTPEDLDMAGSFKELMEGLKKSAQEAEETGTPEEKQAAHQLLEQMQTTEAIEQATKDSEDAFDACMTSGKTAAKCNAELETSATAIAEMQAKLLKPEDVEQMVEGAVSVVDQIPKDLNVRAKIQEGEEMMKNFDMSDFGEGFGQEFQDFMAQFEAAGNDPEKMNQLLEQLQASMGTEA